METPASWVRHLSVEGAFETSARGPFTWIVLSAFVGVVLAVCAYVPPVARATGVSFPWALASFLPLPAFAAVDAALVRARAVKLHVALSLAGNVLVELFPALLVALSRMPGAAVFAAFYLLTTLFHAQLMRISLRWPFFLLSFAATAAVSLVVNHDPGHVALWVLSLPASVAAGLVAGTSAVKADQRRSELFRTQRALAAQLLDVEAKRGQELEEMIRDLLGIAHDIKSPLTAASLELAALERSLARDADALTVERLSVLRASIAKLNDLFLQARARASERQLRSESVRVRAALAEAVASVSRAHARVAIELDAVDDLLCVRVVGGRTTLLRIFENLLVNACEGDGRRAATRVFVSAALSAGGAVQVAVRDDGPGFSEELLASALESFRTTKKTGTGLGLFTADRLVHACGGTLTRGNVDGGGACVTIDLGAA